MIKKKILIATGGTGGHVFPAYSLASYFNKKNFNIKLTIDKRGFEFLKNYDHINLIKIPSSSLSNENIFKFLLSVVKICNSIVRSLIFLLFNRPSLIIGMGGYSSFPICIAALVLRIKFITYENNLVLGKSNKYLLPFAKKMLVSYKELEGVPEKYKYKILEIGNIVREEIIYFNITNKINEEFKNLRILVLGGSQAAKIFAEKLPPIFKRLKTSGISFEIFQQCQKSQNDKLSNLYTELKLDYELFNFSDKIQNYYSKSNIVITRSGASVLGELVNIKIPFISIPLPTSADNHQYKNAKFYTEKGLGFLIEEKDIDNDLYDLIRTIYKEKVLLRNIVFKQSQYSDKDIFKNLKDFIKKIINEKN